VTLTRRYRFCASHRLHVPALSDEQNRALFGKCNNPYGHGHDYVLDITIEGQPDASGQLARRAELDRCIQSRILDRFDHRNLNTEIAELNGRVPTTENVADVVREILDRDWPLTARLHKVRLAETDRNIFELETQ
jgi:6-pyruvoyltetrahydropterin/6-carboxytetrahydropterin synthase